MIASVSPRLHKCDLSLATPAVSDSSEFVFLTVGVNL